MPHRPRVIALDVLDVRFPTSDHLDASDAMNPEPDYSAAYVRLRTDAGDGLEGHALAFTTGRGNDVQATAIASLAPFVAGRPVAEVCGDLGGFARRLVHDPQLRWLGPEKGAIQMATGAVVNASWDLAAKRAGKPVWRFLGDMSPAELVAQVDFRWLSDALTPDEALGILSRARPGRDERIAELLERGYPAYTCGRSRSPPANTSPIGSSSSSCCRPARSTSCRSTRPASAGSTRTSRSCCWPGPGAQMHPASLDEFAYPGGAAWAGRA